MSRPTYRGYTADDLTGPAAGLYSAMRTMGVSERGALREAVNTHMPADRFDNEVRVLQTMNGLTEGHASRAVARRHGGTVAEARRQLSTAGKSVSRPATDWRRVHEAARTAGVLASDEDPWGHEGVSAFNRQIAEAEARGLTLEEAITRATEGAAGSATSRTSTPPADPSSDVDALREANATRAANLLGG